ncbi:MAG: RCC1 domain-containing protein, partial [Kofleriaceae bacterium]
SCAQTTDGGLWCWGMNDEGQLGGGHLVDGPDPGQVEIIGTTATRIALGFDHACAVRDDGSLWCWGKFDNASERALEPVQIAQLAANIQEVAAGNRFTCVRKADDTAWCWGHIGPHADEDLGPASVVQLASDVVELTAGKNHACARTSDGTVWCWGDDQYAQLGDGMKRTGANAQAAIPVPLPGPAASLTSTDYGSCALDAAGDAWCWGSNGLGQFGLGHWDDVLPVTKIMTSCTPPTPPAL